ncbi:MAG: class I SAM-dependent methyltransferase [Chloroflexota bacterium]
MTLDELKKIAKANSQLRGWDFSSISSEVSPKPWDYKTVVRQYLKPTDTVLDVGTGGGEVFLSLADAFESGIGVDQQTSMVATAKENLANLGVQNVHFQQMEADDLAFEDESFDMVLVKHLHVYVDEMARVLRPGGYCIVQAVGMNSSMNMLKAFGWTPQSFGDDWWQPVSAMAPEFEANGCRVLAQAEMNVPCWFKDVESALFFIMAVPWPERIDLDKHGPQILDYLEASQSSRGFESNEHYGLLIVQKR